MTTLNALRTRFDRSRAYRRTLSELRALPRNLRIDLDISGIEEQVARRAVYGA